MILEDNNDNIIYMYGKEAAEGPVLDDTVNIPRGEYDELLSDSMFLGALVVAGVENWSGYDEAEDLFNKWNEEVEVANDS